MEDQGRSFIGSRSAKFRRRSSTGSSLQRLGQFVHRHFLADQTSRPARSPHGTRRADVHGHKAVARATVGTGIGRRGWSERAFREFLVGRGLACDLVNHRGQPAVERRPERHALPGLGAETNRGGKLAPRQFEAHRASRATSGHRGERHVWPGPQCRSERAADIRIDHAHIVRGNAEAARDLVPLVANPLRFAPQRQLIALPLRDGCVRLHRVVLLARREIGRLNADGRGGIGRVGVPLFSLRPAALLGGGFRGGYGEARVEAKARRGIGLIGDAHERCRIKGLRLCRCDHERDGLTAEQDLVILQHFDLLSRYWIDRGSFSGRLIRQPIRVQMREHKQHAGRALGRSGADRDDAPGWYRAVMRCGIHKALGMELGGVPGAARHLGGSVHTRGGCADRTHASAPASANARATVRRISSIL